MDINESQRNQMIKFMRLGNIDLCRSYERSQAIKLCSRGASLTVVVLEDLHRGGEGRPSVVGKHEAHLLGEGDALQLDHRGLVGRRRVDQGLIDDDAVLEVARA